MNPIPAEAAFNDGTAIDAMGHDSKSADVCYRRAIRQEPFTPHYHEALICLQIDCGRLDLAAEALEAALDLILAPDGPDYAVALHGEVDDSDAWAICAEAALHALHHFELGFAKYAIEKIPPEEVDRYSGLKKIDQARLELGAMLEPNYAATLLGPLMKQPVENLMKLPTCRLNPARYVRRR